jgi:hypothetical protein
MSIFLRGVRVHVHVHVMSVFVSMSCPFPCLIHVHVYVYDFVHVRVTCPYPGPRSFSFLRAILFLCSIYVHVHVHPAWMDTDHRHGSWKRITEMQLGDVQQGNGGWTLIINIEYGHLARTCSIDMDMLVKHTYII